MNLQYGQCLSTLILLAPEVFAGICDICIWNFSKCSLASALLKKASDLILFNMIIIVRNLIFILNKNTKLKVHVSKYVGKITGSNFAKICGSW